LDCQDHAVVPLQIARENPQFEVRANYLARSWLDLAALRIALGLAEHSKKEVRAN